MCADGLRFWQIRNIGHTRSGNCSCTTTVHVNPACPVEVHKKKVNVIALSFDGKWVVSGSEDTRLKIWDADTGAKVSIPQ